MTSYGISRCLEHGGERPVSGMTVEVPVGSAAMVRHVVASGPAELAAASAAGDEQPG